MPFTVLNLTIFLGSFTYVYILVTFKTQQLIQWSKCEYYRKNYVYYSCIKDGKKKDEWLWMQQDAEI
jgi:hypothetical protein